jgi:hypothetical protein
MGIGGVNKTIWRDFFDLNMAFSNLGEGVMAWQKTHTSAHALAGADFDLNC